MPSTQLVSFLGAVFLDTVFFLGSAFFGVTFFLGLPSGLGIKLSTSERRTNFRPATSKLWSRPFWTNWRIRSWETPLMRAASACEIQSSKFLRSPSFTIELFKSFRYDPYKF
jgi:hypothetical protein